MNFRVNYVTSDIIQLIFLNEDLMCRTMVRFAEHFESPKFRNRVFTWRQFKSWYAWQRGKFTYYDDWGGFNIPGDCFEPFRAGKFDPLTWGEKDVLKVLEKAPSFFYVIANSEDDAGAIQHELAHALYYLDVQYRLEVVHVLKALPGRDLAMNEIKKLGYCDAVLLDELHAYTMEGFETIVDTLKVYDNLGLKGLVRYYLASRKLKRLLDQALARNNANI